MKCEGLKARHVVDVYDNYSEHPCEESSQVYLKSEADKVIAELKAQKAQAEDDCAYWKMSEGNAANAMHETEEYAMQLYNEASHNKYKRCLAIAWWCRESIRLMRTYEVTEDFWNLEPGQDAEYFCKKGDFYSKWRKRWMELAEKFKPNNSTAQ